MYSIRFSSSARLGLWDYLMGDPDDFIIDLSEILKNNSHASLDSLDIDFIPTSNLSLASLMATLDKILIRGNPTFVDHSFESFFLDQIFPNYLPPFVIHPNSLNILEPLHPLRLPWQPSDILSSFSKFFCLPFSPNYPSFFDSVFDDNSIPSQQVSPEEDLFLSQFMSVFPQHLHHHLMRQALIQDLGNSFDPNISFGRVDFAFQVGNTKLIFEIDGVQHQIPAQKQQDFARDNLNSLNGWHTIRYTASDVRNDLTSVLSSLRDRLAQQDPFFAHLLNSGSVARLIESDRKSNFIFDSFFIPNAIHQALHSLVQLYYNDILDPSRPQHLLVIEEESSIFPFAFKSLFNIWSSLHTLAPETPHPPTLEIDFINSDSSFSFSSNGFVMHHIDKPGEKVYDLILSSSHFLFTGQVGSLEHDLFPIRPTNLVAFRRAFGGHSSSKLLWSQPLHYDLSDVEDAILKQNSGINQPLPKEKSDALAFFLNLIFRKKEFKDGQMHVISRLLHGKHSIVLLPTGGGKSLTYQFSGLLQPGMTIVIDPLISLMDDQVENLHLLGFDMAAAISSQLDQDQKSDILKRMKDGLLSFIFISPERLQDETFRNDLLAVSQSFPISLAVIDEAHCVSEWGHDFRPSYLHLPSNIKKYCANNNSREVTLVGLTGTASFAVLTDVQIEMKIIDEDAIVLPKSFDRKELSFEVIPVRARSKPSQLIALKRSLPLKLRSNPQSFYQLNNKKSNCGLVFCPHTGGSLGVMKVASLLEHSNVYSGKTPKGFPGDDETFVAFKREIQSKFKRNKIQEIVATKSFGMGFDKPNIRYTIHYTAPNSVEAFYQEAGRAGRNGESGYAYCSIIYSDDNWSVAKSIVNSLEPDKAIASLNSINWDDRGDILHQLWFIFNAYPGIDPEVASVRRLWFSKLLPKVSDLPIDSTNTVSVPFNKNNKAELEKSLCRLMILGAIQDYTVNYSTFELKVTVQNILPESIRENLFNYISQYKFPAYAQSKVDEVTGSNLADTISSALYVLVSFIYEEIVAKRKQAIITMGDLCRTFKNDKDFREKILSYLQESEFSDELKDWLKKSFDDIGIFGIKNILSRLNGLEEVKRLVGTTRRMLDEDPFNPALRFLSICARAQSSNESDESVLQEVSTFSSYFARWSDFLKDPNGLLISLLSFIKVLRPSVFDSVGDIIFRSTGNRDFALRVLSSNFSSNQLLRDYSSKILLSSALHEVHSLDAFFSNLNNEVSHG